jgi:hypothetical protein
VPAPREPGGVARSEAADRGGRGPRGPGPALGDASSRTRAEPSWPRVLATTVRLWLKRRNPRRARWAVLLLVLAVAAGSAVLLAQRAAHGTRHRPAGAGPAAERWVAAQVSHSVSVSCDPATCAALQQRGFPATNLVTLHPEAPRPLDSGLIVATAAVRTELGRQLALDAPVVMASFGRGTAGIQIRAVAPAGAAAYLTQFRADARARKSVGTELLGNPAVQADPAASRQLSGGRADARLIALVGIIAALHPVHLVSFGGASPGAAPGVPLRSLVLYGVTHGVTAGTAFLGSLRGLLLAQHPSYRPAGIQAVRLATGQDALRIWFAAPEPLGLLDASQPLVKISPP